jgi:hypothetical protein
MAGGPRLYGVLGLWTDSAVIRICYENFAAGTHDVTALHAKAVRGRRGVTLFLLPGLTAEQRKWAIRRLRQEASRGFGPPLPRAALAAALGFDRLRGALRTVGAAVRLHPAVTLLPGAFMAAAMALFVVTASGGDVITTAGAQVSLTETVVNGTGSLPPAAGGACALVRIQWSQRDQHAFELVRHDKRCVPYK